MQITYQLQENEFTYDFFRALKKTLKGTKSVEFSVKTEVSPYKMSKEAYENMVLEGENSGSQYRLSPQVFENLMVKFEADENFNPIEEIKKHKIN